MAKHPEFKKPEGVTLKQPDPVGNLFGDETPATAADVTNYAYRTPEIEWLDMPAYQFVNPLDGPSEYPHNGEPVWLTPDGETEYIGVWRQTREFKDGRFRPVEFWAQHNGGGLKLPFEPIGYRKYEPPIFVPQRRA